MKVNQQEVLSSLASCRISKNVWRKLQDLRVSQLKQFKSMLTDPEPFGQLAWHYHQRRVKQAFKDDLKKNEAHLVIFNIIIAEIQRSHFFTDGEHEGAGCSACLSHPTVRCFPWREMKCVTFGRAISRPIA